MVTRLYKIIAKALSILLRGVLDHIISVAQGAFIGSRQNIGCGFKELLENYRVSRKKGLVFKIDFEKAYDNIEWQFLNFVLAKKGFSERCWR